MSFVEKVSNQCNEDLGAVLLFMRRIARKQIRNYLRLLNKKVST
jgi:hypothetical protein